MDFSQLRTMLHVAELGSLSKAADRLHIAQPALSRQIRLLEEELGIRLFDRHGRGMIVTEIGREVLSHARRVMSELDEIRMITANPDAPLRGHVSIGMPPTVSDILAAPLVAAFGTMHPEATLRVVSAYSGFLLDWLHRGQVDVAVMYGPRPAKSLYSKPLLEETLYLIGSAKSSLSSDTAVDFAKLEGEKLLLPSPGHGLRDILQRYADERDIRLTVQVEADNFSTLKSLVIDEHGTTILPLAAIHSEITSGQLRYAPIKNPTPMRRLSLSFPTDRPSSGLSRFAADTILETVVDLVTRGIWAGQLLSK